MNLIKELKYSGIVDFKKFWKLWLLSVSLVLIWTSLESGLLYLFRLVVDSGVGLVKPVSKIAASIICIFFVIELSIKITNILIIKLLPVHVATIQKSLLKELLTVWVNFYKEYEPSAVSSKLVNIHNTVENFLKLILYGILSGSFGFFTTVIIIVFSSKLLAMYFLVWMLSMLLLSFITLKRITKLSHSNAIRFNSLTWKLNDVLKNYLIVKSSNRERYEFDRYSEQLNKQIQAKKELEWGLFLADLYRSLASLTFFGYLIYYSLTLLYQQTIMPGEFFFVLSSSIMCRRDVWRVCLHLVDLYQDIGFIAEFNKVKKQAQENSCPNAKDIISENINRLELNKVSLNFNCRKIIRNIDLEFKKGELVGIIGPSGSGKTTVAKLITSFIKPDKGYLKINDKVYSGANCNKNLLYIQQEPNLFKRSVLENITYGKHLDKKRLYEVAKKSICIKFLESSDVSQLSLGQKQRILIARALYHGMKWLILDEPTSFIDPMTAKKLVSNIIAPDSNIDTFILITHNPALLRQMSRVIVVEDGRVTCDSKLEDLSKNKYYKNFIEA